MRTSITAQSRAESLAEGFSHAKAGQSTPAKAPGHLMRRSRSKGLADRTWQFAEPVRRTLLLRVRKDGTVSALRCVLRGEVATYRRSFPAITDATAAEIYEQIFSGPELDFVTPRVWCDGRWVSPLREKNLSPGAENRQRELLAEARQ